MDQRRRYVPEYAPDRPRFSIADQHREEFSRFKQFLERLFMSRPPMPPAKMEQMYKQGINGGFPQGPNPNAIQYPAYQGIMSDQLNRKPQINLMNPGVGGYQRYSGGVRG